MMIWMTSIIFNGQGKTSLFILETKYVKNWFKLVRQFKKICFVFNYIPQKKLINLDLYATFVSSLKCKKIII